jgi:hypothetical protein
LGIILRSDLIWADQVHYTVKNAWKALHFTMRIIEKGAAHLFGKSSMKVKRLKWFKAVTLDDGCEMFIF